MGKTKVKNKHSFLQMVGVGTLAFLAAMGLTRNNNEEKQDTGKTGPAPAHQTVSNTHQANQPYVADNHSFAQAEPAQAEPAQAKPVQASNTSADMRVFKAFPHISDKVKTDQDMAQTIVQMLNEKSLTVDQLVVLEKTLKTAATWDHKINATEDLDARVQMTKDKEQSLASGVPSENEVKKRTLVNDFGTFVQDVYAPLRSTEGVNNPNFWSAHVNAGTDDLSAFERYETAADLQEQLQDLKENFASFDHAETTRDAVRIASGVDQLSDFVQSCAQRNKVNQVLNGNGTEVRDLLYGVSVHLEGKTFLGSLRGFFKSSEQPAPKTADPVNIAVHKGMSR